MVKTQQPVLQLSLKKTNKHMRISDSHHLILAKYNLEKTITMNGWEQYDLLYVLRRNVEGLIPKPKGGSDKEEECWTINILVGLWILNTIEPNLRTTISYIERCDELWADLKERFMSGNALRKHELRTALVNCKQSGMSVFVYYDKLKKI